MRFKYTDFYTETGSFTKEQWDSLHEHDGGRQVTMEQIYRKRIAARRLIPTDADYAAAGVEIESGTCRFIFPQRR